MRCGHELVVADFDDLAVGLADDAGDVGDVGELRRAVRWARLHGWRVAAVATAAACAVRLWANS